MTKKEAKDFYDSRKWESMTSREIVDLQLWEEKLCVPINVFKKALSDVVGRPVLAHELADADRLKAIIKSQDQ